MGTYMTPVIQEVSLLTLGVVGLILGIITREKKNQWILIILQSGLLGMIALLYCFMFSPMEVLFQEHYIHDGLAVTLKLFCTLIMFFIFLYAYDYLKDRHIPFLEFYSLSLFSLLGMYVLISGYSLLTIYLGLELMSLPLYALVGIYRQYPTSQEAALKYFILGGVASGIMLYGISLIYGFTGKVDLMSLLQATVSPSHDIWFIVAMAFILVGIGFKLAIVPFHMWAPDVYAGAPAPVTLLVSTAPKLAGFAMLVRILVDGMPQLFSYWHDVLIIMAVLSITLGNILAIVQKDLKRLLAYSAIAHVGYMLLGMLVGTQSGYVSALFYMIIYALMSLGAFGIIVALSEEGKEIETINDLKGLNARNPLLAFMMLLVLFSMAGIPPLAGFLAKFLVLKALIEIGYVKLAVYALLMAVVGAYYYIYVIKVMYFDESDEVRPVAIKRYLTWETTVNGLALLGLGLFPVGLLQLCQSVFILY